MLLPKTVDDRNGVNVTGRGRYVICQALAYATIAIEALPEDWRQQSDAEDMHRLLKTLADDPDFYRLWARSHLEQCGLTASNGQLELRD
jgi:hypothetical protein